MYQAARLKKQIAEMFENDKEYVLAAQNYAEAVELYEMDGDGSS